MHRSWMAIVAALAAVVCLGSCGGDDAGSNKRKLMVGTLPIDAGAQAFYAKDKGFFKKEGLEVEVRQFGSGAAIAAAVASGDVDVGFSNVISIATAREKGLPLKMIAPANLYSSREPTSALLVPKKSSVRTAADLDGKTIAVDGLKNITQVAAEAWLDGNGGDPKRVRFLEIDFPDMGTALAAGRVDAALVAEPALTGAKADGRLLANAYDAVGDKFLIAAWFTSEQWLEQNPDSAKRVQRAILDSARFANRDQKASGAILAKYAKLPPGVVGKMTRAAYAERLDASEIRPPLEAARRYGALEKAPEVEPLLASPPGS